MKYIIALTGLAGSGKDSVADAIIERYEGFAKMRWADPLKDLVFEQFGDAFSFTREMLDGNNEADRQWRERPLLGLEMSPRQILQHVGTEGFRTVHDKHWVNQGVRRALDTLAHPEIRGVVIPDTRFPNEGDAVRKLNGEIESFGESLFEGGGEEVRAVVFRTVRAGQVADQPHASERLVGQVVDDAGCMAEPGNVSGLVETALDTLRIAGALPRD